MEWKPSNELVERIEAAEGPSRELDVAIAMAVGAKHGPESGWANSENGDYWVVRECAARYTESLDAAMTLIGHLRAFDLCRSSTPDEHRPWRAFVNHNDSRSRAATPALALCAAALRARQENSHG